MSTPSSRWEGKSTRKDYPRAPCRRPKICQDWDWDCCSYKSRGSRFSPIYLSCQRIILVLRGQFLSPSECLLRNLGSLYKTTHNNVFVCHTEERRSSVGKVLLVLHQGTSRPPTSEEVSCSDMHGRTNRPGTSIWYLAW